MSIHNFANEVAERLDHDSLCAAIKAGDWTVAEAAKRSAWFAAATAEHERQMREMLERVQRFPTADELAPIACMKFYKAHPNVAGTGILAVMAKYMREVGEVVPFRCAIYKDAEMVDMWLEWDTDCWHVKSEAVWGETRGHPADLSFDTLDGVAGILELRARCINARSSTLVPM